MGCSTYLGLGWRYQPLAPGHPTSICDIGVKKRFCCFLKMTNALFVVEMHLSTPSWFSGISLKNLS